MIEFDEIVEKIIEKLDRRFHCPKCESFQFGSSKCNEDIMIRHCHGPGCGFSFPSTDDEKYFIPRKSIEKTRKIIIEALDKIKEK